MHHPISDFSSRLIAWQRAHGRHDLPWQGADAYRVWLSEIMLQQTQVATVIPYYQRFVASFPNVAALAAATEDQVLAHWSGLGYYARGRNLHQAARLIVEQHRGEFPREFEQILALPGIGRSTAAAICALAYHERRAILDGNVKRVLSRYCGIEGWAGNKPVEARLWQQAEALLPASSRPSRVKERGESDIAIYTQSLMDIGATICTRSKPKCGLCPVQTDCIACQTDAVQQLPTPRPRKAVPERQATFLLLMHGNDILLEKRPGSGIWGGLWCPPQLDDGQAAMAWCAQRGIVAGQQFVGADLSANIHRQQVCPEHSRRAGSYDGTGAGGQECLDAECEALPTFTHTFTHFRLHITPVLLRLEKKPRQAQQPGSLWLDLDEALQAAIPTPVRKMLRAVQAGRC